VGQRAGRSSGIVGLAVPCPPPCPDMVCVCVCVQRLRGWPQKVFESNFVPQRERLLAMALQRYRLLVGQRGEGRCEHQ
jgi:hypothetical protein